MDENTQIWKEWENGQDYLDSSGIRKSINECIDFFEGRQWKKATDRTKFMPRPVINITNKICTAKISGVLNAPVNIVFKTEDDVTGRRYTHFADYINKEIDQEGADKRAVKNGAIKKLGVWHYYWDNDGRGKDGIKEGALRVEIIEPTSIVFANPEECDEQKQKYIIIGTRVDIDTAKSMAEDWVDKDLITPDDDSNKENTDKQEGTEIVTVLTKYYRVNGEVYWVKSVKGTEITRPTALAPDLAGARKELGLEEDAPNSELPDSQEEEIVPATSQAPLYPIVLWQFYEKHNCIYGLSEAEGVVPNNKVINFLNSMYTYAVQQSAWGKYIVTPNALKGQKIGNAPGQVLINYDEANPNAIRKLSEQPVHSEALVLVDKIIEITRSMTGSTEVMTGEALGKNQSGAAIAQLQMQGQQPLEEIKSRFWLAKRKQGYVEDQFFKNDYSNVRFTFEEEIEGENGERQERLIEGVFNSVDFKQTYFDVVPEAMAGTKASIVSDISMLENLKASGEIDTKTFIDLYPSVAISNKQQILEALEKNEIPLRVQIQQLTAQLEQSQAYIQQQEKIVSEASSMIEENNRLKAQLVALYSEANDKILQANDEINAGNMKIEETENDARYMSEELFKRMQGEQP